MHPETDIAREFWVYVTKRAHGDSTGAYPWRRLVAIKEMEEFDGAVDRADLSDEMAWGNLYNFETGLPPCGFPTLQDALYDYLLAHISWEKIAFKYTVWLRAVAHILADVAHHPDWLTVGVGMHDDTDPHNLPHTPHTMTVSDDWSVLNPDTFKYVCHWWCKVKELGSQEIFYER